VVLAGRRPEPLQALAAGAQARGQAALAVPTDVGDPANPGYKLEKPSPHHTFQ
jgi:NADP-dependent 3-hydroxy acid dehydrogenase YdfG